MLCLHVFLCTMCVPCAHRGQRRMLDPLELGLQTFVRFHVYIGNWTKPSLEPILIFVCVGGWELGACMHVIVCVRAYVHEYRCPKCAERIRFLGAAVSYRKL